MLITCTTCQTRFRVPDDQIGPKGARVRCSRCRALFTVRPPAAPEAPPAPPAAAPLPPPLAGRPAPPPPPGTGATEIELTSDPFALQRGQAPPRDDPFAPRPSAADPFAPGQPDPFAAEPFPPRAAAAPPFATRPPADPFTAVVAPGPGPGVPFARPPPGDPFGTPPPEPVHTADLGELGPSPVPEPSGGIALEQAERRERTRPANGSAALDAAERNADFRTPGPSGLEVDMPREEVAPALPPPSPPPPVELTAAPEPPPPRRSAPPAPVAPPQPLGRRALGVLVNSLSLALLLVLAGGLFVYWKGGGTEALWATMGRSRSPADFTAQGVSSGLYDTAVGRPVLFVRGTILARQAAGRVRVRVELVNGGRALAKAEGLLGGLPTPEEVWTSEPARAAELGAASAARAPGRVGAGETVPFLVILWEYPADLRGLDVRVAAEPLPPGSLP